MIRSPLIKRLFGRRPPSGTEDELRFDGARPSPDRPIAVIGDIHGAYDCLDRLITKIDALPTPVQLVFVGDYIDRGDQSADVLARLVDLQSTRPDTVCLMGNHEEMMLSFLDDPEKYGNWWMRFGGLQTVASFASVPLRSTSSAKELRAARDHLRAHMPDQLETWLRNLPRSWQSGNVAVVHAGADPRLPMSSQTNETLTWGHRLFGQMPRDDKIWVVHGHTIVDHPKEENGVISIDTGAYATQRLTAVILGDGDIRYEQG